jgi:hypothetical protein
MDPSNRKWVGALFFIQELRDNPSIIDCSNYGTATGRASKCLDYSRNLRSTVEALVRLFCLSELD